MEMCEGQVQTNEGTSDELIASYLDEFFFLA